MKKDKITFDLFEDTDIYSRLHNKRQTFSYYVAKVCIIPLFLLIFVIMLYNIIKGVIA